MLLIAVPGFDRAGFLTRARKGSLPRLSALARAGGCHPLIDAVGGPGPADLATMATGRRPEQHGIWRWDEAWAGGVRPLTRASWQVPPLWARLEAAGIATGSVGWPGVRPGAEWTTWHVDEDFAPSSGRFPADWALPRQCAPAAAREGLRTRRVHITEISADMLRPFVPSLDEIDQTHDTQRLALAGRVAEAATTLGAAAWLLEEAEPIPQAIFVDLTFLAATRGPWEGAAAPFDQAAEAAWRFLDGLVGRLVDLAGQGATILIAGTGWRGAGGAFIFSGEGVSASGPPIPMRLADMAPTVLATFGLSDPELPGRLVLPALAHAPARPAPCPPAPGAAAADESLLAIAEAAGFARPPAVSAAWRAQRSAELAALLVLHDPGQAAMTAQVALDLDPDNLLALVLRVRTHLIEGELERVPPLAERLRRVAPDGGWGALAEGASLIGRGEREGGVALLRLAEADPDPSLRASLAVAWLAAGAPDQAQRLLRETLAARPDDLGARVALALCSADTGNLASAERELRALIDDDPGLVPVHLELARLLARSGRGGEAEVAAQAAARLGAKPEAVAAARRGRRA